MNLKKYAAVMAALMLVSLAATTGCNMNNKESSATEESSSVSVTESSDNSEEETQPDPLAPKDESSAHEEKPTESDSDEEQTTEAQEEDENAENSDDAQLIADAEALFKSACETNWNYHVGCPYPLDYASYIENEYGWQFFLVTESSVNSIADVEADYHKIFSDTYENDLNEIYMESDGRVYALDGERGADIFYQGSRITGITEKTDTEIFFTVENSYSGDDFAPNDAYTETKAFSVVIHEDGSLRVGEFTLPY